MSALFLGGPRYPARMWEAHPDVLVTDLGDELVLMQAARGLMYSLNRTGRTAWMALPASAEVVGEALARAFDVPPEQAGADAGALLSELAAQGMVRRV